MERYIAELLDVASEAADLVTAFEISDMSAQVEAIRDAVDAVERAWSGSNFGYHARVYYEDFKRPPSDTTFDVSVGLVRGRSSINYGWKTYTEDAVRAHVRTLSGDVDLLDIQRASDAARETILRLKSTIASILSNCLAIRDDSFLTDLKAEVNDVSAPNAVALARRYVPFGKTIRTRDMKAVNEGSTWAPHQKLRGELDAAEAPYVCAKALADYATNAAAHLGRFPEETTMATTTQLGTRVFIGHGGSTHWLELKNYLQDRVGAPVDDFNRVPTAGFATVRRLTEMLDSAAMAFLVMTAEDETSDGEQRARQNVVHEVGLFQGRLGFDRAIVMLEDGCDEFSNIHGLTQLRYPKGQISAVFHEVRDLLEREDLV